MPETKKACNNGDKVYHTFSITNTGTGICHAVSGTITVPPGVDLKYRSSDNSFGPKTPVVTAGVFNPVDYIWHAGDLSAGQKETISVEFEIADETLFGYDDFIIEFDITSSCEEPTEDNMDWLCIEKYCTEEGDDSCVSTNIILK